MFCSHYLVIDCPRPVYYTSVQILLICLWLFEKQIGDRIEGED
jgi:hypothetical protein